MKERDLNKFGQQSEFGRLKDILFPKKNKKVVQISQLQQEYFHEERPKDTCMKNDIQKLRGEIHSMLENGKTDPQEGEETQRAYLDGINQLAKGLKDYSSQIQEAFEQFLDHLPTHLALDKKNYKNHYYLSLLTQNYFWGRIGSIFKQTKSDAFQAIVTESNQIKEEQETEIKIKNQREVRYKNRITAQLNKFFNVWRFKSTCLGLQFNYEEFMRENNIEIQRKIMQNIHNLPVLVFMLQEICRQTSDLTEIVLFDQKTNRLCKFLEEGFECLNTSLETVTQRSMLSHRDFSQKKIRRFQFDLRSSLTKLCIERREILFVVNLLKHPEYNDIDNTCISQTNQASQGRNIDGGLVLYPLLDTQGRLRGVIRQYYSPNSLKYLPNQKIEMVSMLIEQSISLENHSRQISKEKQYLKEDYYLNMIKLIKTLQKLDGSTKNILEILSKELTRIFRIKYLSVYKLEKSENQKKGIIIHNIFGKSGENELLLSIVNQFMKKEANHTYLSKRLLICSNMILFDLQQEDNSGESSQREQILPVQLISKVIIKIQEIYTNKEKQNQIQEKNQQKMEQIQKKQQQNQRREDFLQKSLNAISNISQEKCPFSQIISFLSTVNNFKQNSVILTLAVESKEIKAERKLFTFEEKCWKSQKDSDITIPSIEIKINNAAKLFISTTSNDIQYPNEIKSTVESYIKKYLSICLKRQTFPFHFDEVNQEATFPKPLESISSLSLKKEWQLKCIKHIYQSFKKELMKNQFSTDKQVQWINKEPQEVNFQEWKQNIFTFIFCDPEKISIGLTHNNPQLSIEQYRELNALGIETDEIVEPKTFLSLSALKKTTKIKNLHSESSVVVVLPIYLPSDEGFRNPSVNAWLESLKRRWISLCKTLIEGSNSIILNIKKNTVNKMKVLLTNRKMVRLELGFRMIQQKYRQQKEQLEKILKLKNILARIERRTNFVTFMNLKVTLNNQKQKNIDFYFFNLGKLTQTLSKIIFGKYFSALKNQHIKSVKLQLMLNILQNFNKFCTKCTVSYAFSSIFYTSKRTRSQQLIANSLRHIFEVKFINFFNKIKHFDCELPIKPSYSSQFMPQNITNIKQISRNIKNMTPNYRLYRLIDSLHCCTIYSNDEEPGIIELEKVVNTSFPWLVYQIGSDNQLLWHYTVEEGQDNFKIKDKLNNMSKSIEQSLKQSKELTQISLTKVFLIKNKFLSVIRARYFKTWRQQSKQICLNWRNRLNDSLYQISIEGQTMKQKLILQEKTLKNNSIIYQQLQNKKEEYINLIDFSSSHVEKIEESFNKLENTRNLYTSLHKRTVLKSCLLIWRNNSQKLNLLQKMVKKHRLQHRVSIETIESILTPKYENILKSIFANLKQMRILPVRRLEITKIPVNFEQNSDRLVTFQSQLEEKENSNKNSNRSDSPEQHQKYHRANRMKMEKMKEEHKSYELSVDELSKYSNGAYKLNPKTLKFLKRMGKLEQ